MTWFCCLWLCSPSCLCLHPSLSLTLRTSFLGNRFVTADKICSSQFILANPGPSWSHLIKVKDTSAVYKPVTWSLPGLSRYCPLSFTVLRTASVSEENVAFSSVRTRGLDGSVSISLQMIIQFLKDLTFLLLLWLNYTAVLWFCFFVLIFWGSFICIALPVLELSL